MERNIKEYSKPLMVMEKFVPQEYCSGCAETGEQVYTKVKGVYYADIFNGNIGYEGSYGSSDGKCQMTQEAFNYGYSPNGVTNSQHIGTRRWYYNVTLYTPNTTSTNGKSYNNYNYFSPISGYEHVDIYVDVSKCYIWKNGAPSDVTIIDGTPQKTFS